MYRSWADRLGADVEVWGVQPPGRENQLREPAYTELRELAAAAAEAIRPYTDSTYAFFGHSMGAVVAFEAARSLRASGVPEPAWLFVSGRRSPRLAETDPPLHGLPDDAFVQEIQRRYGGIPEQVLEHRDLLTLLLPGLRADVRAFETYAYVPSEPLRCPITALAGLLDPHAARGDVEAWRAETVGPFDLRLYPGGHFYLGAAQSEVTTHVATTLRRVLRAGGMPWQEA